MGDLLPGPGGALGHHATLPPGWGGHHLSPGPVGGVALPLRHALAPQVVPGLGSRSRILPDPPATSRGPLPPTWGPHHVSPRPGWGAALHGTPVPAGGCRRRQAVVPHQKRPGVYLCIAWQKLFLKRFFRNKQEHQSKVFIIKSPWSDHMFCDDSSGEHAKIFRMNTFHTWLDTSVRLADSFITSWCVGAPVN